MQAYLPSEEELKDAFLRWLNEERKANFVATSRPDRVERKRRVERQKKEVDYVLEDRAKSAKLALEISTIWRSTGAGKEDAEFAKWADKFCATVSGRVAGSFQLDLPMTVSSGCDPVQLGEELVGILPKLETRVAALGRTIPLSIQGADMRFGRISTDGSEILPVRMSAFDYLPELKKDVEERLEAKAVKLLSYKQRGFETWILVYSTAWPLFAPDDVQNIVSSSLGTAHAHVDHVGVWNGSRVANGWMILVR